jgi:hypothetical protein
LARPAVSRRLVIRAKARCLIDFIGAQYRRFLLPNKARRTPSSTQPAQGKTGYGSLPRFPLRLCLNFRPEPNHLLEARLKGVKDLELDSRYSFRLLERFFLLKPRCKFAA